MPTASDTYFYLLENEDSRNLDLCSEDFMHRTRTFSQPVYEESRSRSFASREEAYLDWINVGRPLGLAFADGRNTSLKIILKVKDEPQLFPQWIAYHAAIVGDHNIVVVDCGSEDPAFLDMLSTYGKRSILFRYNGYYDNLHHMHGTESFYRLIAGNCAYFCVLDADEFLFGHVEGRIGPGLVRDIIGRGEEQVYAGTWYPNTSITLDGKGGVDWTPEISFLVDDSILRYGTVAGKALVRSSICFDAGYVGHNMHVKRVVDHLTPGSFGRIGIMHVSNLGPHLIRQRSLKHLRAKGLVPAGMVAHRDICAVLEEKLATGHLTGIERHYLERYLDAAMPSEPAATTFSTAMIGTGADSDSPLFAAAVAAFDFGSLLKDYSNGLAPA